jgi:LCP family protein required for cell wall assembly
MVRLVDMTKGAAKSKKSKTPVYPVIVPQVTPPTEKKAYPEPLSLGAVLVKATALAILFASILLLITAGAVGLYIYKQVKVFAATSGYSIAELKATVDTGWHAQPTQTNGRKNILLLGTDTLPNRGDVPALTDTLMLASINLETGSIKTLPLPRDLWSDGYKTKINALYSYGKERYPDKPEQFSTEVISEMTGVPIHHTIVVTIGTVSQIIDVVGGVEVNVIDGFTDTQFPRSDVDITKERDPKKLYETITFTPGKQVMNGETALKYMRSRHSEGDTGTDIARGIRQQQVIDALLQKSKDPEIIGNPQKLGELYAFYTKTFGTVFPVTEAIATGKMLYPHKDAISHASSAITVYPEDPNGIIVNPPVTKYKQWVYEIRDPEKFKTEVQKDLGIL